VSDDPGPLIALLSAPIVIGAVLASLWGRMVASGWSSIANAGFDLSAFTPDVLADEWIRARVGMKHFEASDTLTYFHVKAQATAAGLVATDTRRGARWPGARPLYIPWEHVAVVDPDDPHHRGSDLCLHVGGRASVLLSVEGKLADAIRAALAARVQPMPAAPPYR
jgi:hypothetical protein